MTQSPQCWFRTGIGLLFVLLVCMQFPASASSETSFPLRPYYPEVPVITTERLLETYNSVIIMDIRSRFEYDVARINKAILLPLTDSDFAFKLEHVRRKDDPTPLAFYCNGHTCAKSYKAAQKAMSLGFENIFVYDGGIFDWITAAPEKATLMGTTPARRESIISKKDFDSRLLGFNEFAAKATEPNTVVIDIRDPFQREVIPRVSNIRNIPLDPLLDLVVSRVWTEKQLLFFDAVGKQVRWLQYFLESYGYYNYAFLAGGMKQAEKDKNNIEPVIEGDRFVLANQDALLGLIRDKRLAVTDRSVLGYLVASVKFNNYVVTNLETARTTLGMDLDTFMNGVRNLTRYGYADHTVMQDTLIAQIDPRLAWKGDTQSALWNEKKLEFENLNTSRELKPCSTCD